MRGFLSRVLLVSLIIVWVNASPQRRSSLENEESFSRLARALAAVDAQGKRENDFGALMFESGEEQDQLSRILFSRQGLERNLRHRGERSRRRKSKEKKKGSKEKKHKTSKEKKHKKSKEKKHKKSKKKCRGHGKSKERYLCLTSTTSTTQATSSNETTTPPSVSQTTTEQVVTTTIAELITSSSPAEVETIPGVDDGGHVRYFQRMKRCHLNEVTIAGPFFSPWKDELLFEVSSNKRLT